MEPTNDVQSVIKGKPKAVNVSSIERELTELWRAAAEAAEEKSQPAVMRACALNLLVYFPNDLGAENVDDWIAQLMEQHPLRAIVMMAGDPSGESSLAAWISAHCRRPTAEGKQICSEQIMLQATGDAIHELPSTAVSLLAPDLPVILWWRGDPAFESEIFAKLIEMSDRVLLDSYGFRNPEAELFQVAKRVKDRSVPAAFSDLSWTRLTPWRELTAQFFDAPNFRSSLARINQVIVEYKADDPVSPPNPVAAILIAAWLASRLHWKPAPQAYRVMGRHRVLNLSESGRRIIVELRAVPSPDGVAGDLVSLKLMEEGETGTAQFSISKTKDPRCAETCITGTGINPIQRTVRMEVGSELALVGKELEILGHDATYEEALEIVDWVARL
ncbi:MAG: glucose-6-phosphate dehydrogenase assembly protein OpcA [Acidobacteria bacterium]|nr:glucose-6-phosphate dehydrogenase assembly protein OpcA [Acidobacteriota bacterium]MBI3658518.1 glucose-6-phosphate dehydrogenase assembly protein OpcA [Acidobacteriota bacterium]